MCVSEVWVDEENRVGFEMPECRDGVLCVRGFVLLGFSATLVLLQLARLSHLANS